MKKFSALILVAAAASFTVPASAQFAKPEDAVKYRKSAMFLMQQNFGRVAGMASGRLPFDAKVAADSAVVADFIAKLPWPAYVLGTDKGETRAKSEIWANKAKFDEYASKLQVETNKLVVATKTGSLDNIKVAVNATVGACNSCHDDFRAK
jgi:cytochrome c556